MTGADGNEINGRTAVQQMADAARAREAPGEPAASFEAPGLLAMSDAHKAAYLAFRAAANTLKTAEAQYKAAQQAYAKAVAELSRAVTEEPVPSSGESPPAQ